MAEELQLRNENWSEGTSKYNEERVTPEELTPARKKSRSNKRGTRRCPVLGCASTFDGAAPMVWHVWKEHCPVGVEEPDFLVQFLREIARLLHLPQEGRDDERALNDLRALVQRFFRPVLWGFARRWLDKANALSERVGMVPLSLLDLEWMKQGLIVHPCMLAHPRLIAIALNKLTPLERQHVRQMSHGGSHSSGVARVLKGRSHESSARIDSSAINDNMLKCLSLFQHLEENCESENVGSQ